MLLIGGVAAISAVFFVTADAFERQGPTVADSFTEASECEGLTNFDQPVASSNTQLNRTVATFPEIVASSRPSDELKQFLNDLPLPNGRFRDGLHRFTYPSGRIHVEETWRGGLRQGHAAYYDDESGGILTEGNYLDGLMDGEWVTFAENGQLSEKGNYQRNLRQGTWTFWRFDGAIDEERTGHYKNGRKVQ